MLIGNVGLTFVSDSTTKSLFKTTSFSPQPNLPIVRLLLPVGSRPLTRSGWHSSIFPTSCPTPSSLRSCASPTSSVSSSNFSPFSRFGTSPSMPSTSDEFTLRSPRFSVNVPLMTASASSPRPSCNHSRIQWNCPYHLPHNRNRNRSTKAMKARMVHQRIFTFPSPLPTTQNPSRPESIFVPYYSIHYSKLLPLTLSSASPLSPALPPVGK